MITVILKFIVICLSNRVTRIVTVPLIVRNSLLLVDLHHRSNKNSCTLAIDTCLPRGSGVIRKSRPPGVMYGRAPSGGKKNCPERGWAPSFPLCLGRGRASRRPPSRPLATYATVLVNFMFASIALLNHQREKCITT
jgi:hypothetical protein